MYVYLFLAQECKYYLHNEILTHISLSSYHLPHSVCPFSPSLRFPGIQTDCNFSPNRRQLGTEKEGLNDCEIKGNKKVHLSGCVAQNFQSVLFPNTE